MSDVQIDGSVTYVGGSGLVHRIKGSAADPGSTDFNFYVLAFPVANLPADTRGNVVARLGWNVGPGGGREDPTDAALSIAFEQHFHAAFEWHLEMLDTSDVPHRLITAFMPKDGGLGSDLGLQADHVYFGDYDGLQRVLFNFVDNTIQFANGDLALLFANNSPALRQRNAADSAYINLPYIGADDALTGTTPLRFAGATPTKGGDANTFAVIRANSGVHGGRVLLVDANFQLVGSIDLAMLRGYATGEVRSTVSNAKTAGGGAAHCITVADENSGDPVSRYAVTDGTQWSVGLDNSDADKFKWGTGALGSADKMTLDTSGNLALAGDHINVATAKTPASAGAAGAAGDIAWDSGFVYVCVAANTWKRAALSTW